MNDHHLSDLTDFNCQRRDSDRYDAHVETFYRHEWDEEQARFYGFDEAITHALQRPLPSLWERLVDRWLTLFGR
jgi:hypothetical protein